MFSLLQSTGSCTLALAFDLRALAIATATTTAALVHDVAVQRDLRRRLVRRHRGSSGAATVPVNVSELQFPRALLAASVARLVQSRGLGLRVVFECPFCFVSMLGWWLVGAWRGERWLCKSRQTSRRRRIARVLRFTSLVATGIRLLLGRMRRS